MKIYDADDLINTDDLQELAAYANIPRPDADNGLPGSPYPDPHKLIEQIVIRDKIIANDSTLWNAVLKRSDDALRDYCDAEARYQKTIADANDMVTRIVGLEAQIETLAASAKAHARTLASKNRAIAALEEKVEKAGELRVTQEQLITGYLQEIARSKAMADAAWPDGMGLFKVADVEAMEQQLAHEKQRAVELQQTAEAISRAKVEEWQSVSTPAQMQIQLADLERTLAERDARIASIEHEVADLREVNKRQADIIAGLQKDLSIARAVHVDSERVEVRTGFGGGFENRYRVGRDDIKVGETISAKGGDGGLGFDTVFRRYREDDYRLTDALASHALASHRPELVITPKDELRRPYSSADVEATEKTLRDAIAKGDATIKACEKTIRELQAEAAQRMERYETIANVCVAQTRENKALVESVETTSHVIGAIKVILERLLPGATP